MSGVEEYRLTLDFRPRWQLLSALAGALQSYEAEVDDGPCEVLVGGDLHGGVSLIVRCPAMVPLTADETVDGGDSGPVPPGPVSPVRGVGRRRAAASSPPPRRSSGDLSGDLVGLLRVLHGADGAIADAAGSATARLAEALSCSTSHALKLSHEAASIGLVRRKVNAKRTYEIALTPVGLAALDRVLDSDATEPGGGCCRRGPGQRHRTRRRARRPTGAHEGRRGGRDLMGAHG